MRGVFSYASCLSDAESAVHLRCSVVFLFISRVQTRLVSWSDNNKSNHRAQQRTDDAAINSSRFLPARDTLVVSAWPGVRRYQPMLFCPPPAAFVTAPVLHLSGGGRQSTTWLHRLINDHSCLSAANSLQISRHVTSAQANSAWPFFRW